MECRICKIEKKELDYYNNDSACKECRKAKVRANRAKNIGYYRAYDNARAMRPDRVAARESYAKTPNGLAAFRKARKKWESKNFIKKGASTIVGNAVRDGLLEKPSRCESCQSAPNRLHGHHDDYAKPLEVRWLCSVCHRQWHTENGEAKNG